MAATYHELLDLVDTLAKGSTEIRNLECEARVLLARKDERIDITHDVNLGEADTFGMTGGQAALLVESGFLRHKQTTIVIEYELVDRGNAALVARVAGWR